MTGNIVPDVISLEGIIGSDVILSELGVGESIRVAALWCYQTDKRLCALRGLGVRRLLRRA